MFEIVPLSGDHERSGFDCGIPELNVFLKATARQHTTKGISRTFVMIDQDSPSTVIGFFTLTLCEVSAGRLPSAYARKYPRHGLPAVRLARLAVSRRHQGKGCGELLLADAIHRTVLIAEQAGVIGLFVDAKNAGACTFYKHFGFESLPEHDLHLFLPIKTLREIILG